jgi:hypothetical protein
MRMISACRFPRYLSITNKGRHFAFVTEVLAPRLPLLGRLAEGFAEADEGFSEGMGVDVGQPGGGEGIPENLADRSCRPP